jgi:tetratricopeptide (TPR) repeat protein
MNQHYWIRGRRRADREATVAALRLPPRLATLDAHRRLRGPYTATGTLLRQIVPDALSRRPELGPRHYIEIATSAPELADLVPPMLTSLEWRVGEEERTRYYSRLHTLNIANGLAELVRDHLADLGDGPRSIVFENVHEADATDQEFIAVLLRRGDLDDLTVVVNTGVETLPEAPGEVTISLPRILSDRARAIEADPTARQPDSYPENQDTAARADGVGEATAAALAYVDGDCTSDDPRLVAAYEALDASPRAALHKDRLDHLVALGEPSIGLGAIVFHAERAADPAGALTALQAALRRCRGVGLYQAAVDLGMRGRALVQRSQQPELWWHFTDATGVCLASLGRADEAAAMYAEARAATQDPLAHMELAYGMAMLYARHYPEPRRDFQLARGWMNLSIAIASQIGEPKQRAFHSVFGDNGLALVEMRENGPEQALRLLEAGITRLDAELAPQEQALHRLVLRYNRAQVLGSMGRLDESLADYETVVQADPDFPEHHFNIGNILRRLGRNREAVAAYERALTKSPPFPEAYYNLGDSKLELGDVEGALADFSYTIVLDPDRIEAHVNLASLLYHLDRPGPALESVEVGLARVPTNARLLSLKAQLLAESGDLDAARDLADAALEVDERLGEAWAIRAELAYRAGDVIQAVADFDRALELTDKPAFRFNRAVVHQDAGHFAAAAADFEAVLTASPDQEASQRLAACSRMLAQSPAKTPA